MNQIFLYSAEFSLIVFFFAIIGFTVLTGTQKDTGENLTSIGVLLATASPLSGLLFLVHGLKHDSRSKESNKTGIIGLALVVFGMVIWFMIFRNTLPIRFPRF